MAGEAVHWRKVEELGSGGFGCVILLKDEVVFHYLSFFAKKQFDTSDSTSR
jgi:hypothetical protein